MYIYQLQIVCTYKCTPTCTCTVSVALFHLAQSVWSGFLLSFYVPPRFSVAPVAYQSTTHAQTQRHTQN